MAETLSEPQKAALKALPWHLTAQGNLSHNAPHAGVVRALERRGLVRLDPRVGANGAWVRTIKGDEQLAWEDS